MGALAEAVSLEPGEVPAADVAALGFGNVLGSKGSVIPVFKRQIEAGKP